MSWKGLTKKRNYMLLFAEEWNTVIDALDELYSGRFGALTQDLVPYQDGTVLIGTPDKRFKEVHAIAGYFEKVDADKVQTEQIEGGVGFFRYLYLDSTPVQAIVGKIPNLVGVTSDIIPYEDNLYDIGKPEKRWRNIHAVMGWFNYLYLNGDPITPLQYVTQYITNITYEQFYPYVFVERFSDYSLQQLYEAFGKDLKEVKVLMSKKLAVELYDTVVKNIDTSTESSPVVVYTPNNLYFCVVRGWFLLTNSNTGEIELKYVPSLLPIAWLPANIIKQSQNKDTFIEGYMNEPIFLYWSGLSAGARIFLQLDVLQKYIYEQ